MNNNIDIKTYKNIYGLDEYIRNNKDVLYICALVNTSTAMNYKHGSKIQLPIIDVGSMIRSIVNEWESVYVKVHQKLKIKEIIKKLLQENRYSKETIEDIQENLDDMISSIRLLCECGVYPGNLMKNGTQLSKEEEIFVKIWNELELNDDSINKFKGELFRNLEDKQYLQKKTIEGINCSIRTQITKMKILVKNIESQIKDIDKNILDVEEELKGYISILNRQPDKYDKYEKHIEDGNLEKKELEINKNELEQKINIINEVIEKYDGIKIDKLPQEIVFQGFYFITPIQERFIQLFREKLDVNITFLNHYNEDYKKLFMVWEKTFSPGLKTGYPKCSEWKKIDSKRNNIVTWAEKFAELYCEKNLLKDEIPYNRLQIFEYENVISFNSSLNTGKRYYSPAYKELNEILHNPNKAEIECIKRLIKSPLGSFIKYINQIWEKNINYDKVEEIVYDIDLLKKCFATGWLTSGVEEKEIHAIDYVYKLEVLKPYIGTEFNRKKLECKLRQITENRGKLEKMVSSKSISANIIDGFGFYRINEGEDILEFINGINQIINGLRVGSSNDKIGINRYADNIKKELIDRLSMYKEEFDENEVKIIDNFISLLNFESNAECSIDSKFYIKDITEAVNEFIDIGNDEDSIEIGKIMDLKDLSIESIVYEGDSINICQITDKNIPGTKSRYTWPLSKIFIEKIRCEDETQYLLGRIVSIIENNEIKNKYLFFNALQSTDNINISHIKNINNESIETSSYIKLIYNFFGIKPSSFSYNFGKNKYGSGEVNIKNTQIEYNNMEQIEEIIFDVCPKRWMYFLADNKSIIYELENHQGTYFSRFINVLSEKLILDTNNKYNTIRCYDRVLEVVQEFFPNFSDIEKKHFKEKALNYRENNERDTACLIDNNSDYNTIVIPNVKDAYGDNINYIQKKLNKKNDINTMRGIPYGDIRIDRICKNCNYLNYCRDAKYPIDLK